MEDIQPKHFSGVKRTYIGRDRRMKWALNKVSSGQFITFLYKSKSKKSRTKRRFLLVLSDKFIPKQMKKSPNPKRTYMISGVDFGQLKNRPQQIIELFRSNKLTKNVNITTVDKTGFRFFEAYIPDEKKMYNKLKTFIVEDQKDSLYKTFDYDKLRTSSIDLYNPKFPPEIIKKMNIINKDLYKDYIYE